MSGATLRMTTAGALPTGEGLGVAELSGDIGIEGAEAAAAAATGAGAADGVTGSAMVLMPDSAGASAGLATAAPPTLATASNPVGSGRAMPAPAWGAATRTEPMDVVASATRTISVMVGAAAWARTSTMAPARVLEVAAPAWR